MGRCSPIAPLDSFHFRQAQLEALACIHKDDLVLTQEYVGIETRRKLGLNFWIAVHRRSHRVSGPALQKRFARGDPRLDVDLYPANFSVGLAPAGRPELTEGVVLCGEALKIKEQMPLAFTRLMVAR